MRILTLSALLVGCQPDYQLQSKDDNLGGLADTGTSDPDGDDPGAVSDPSKLASVKGRVCNPAGDGYVVGATAYVTYDSDGDGSSDARVQDLTDGDGYFLLEGVPLGQHTIHIEKGSFTADITVLLDTEGELVELAEEECLDATDVNIAVVTGQYDHIGEILDGLGLEYTTYVGTSNQYVSLLRDPAAMAEYDIIFFNCGMSDGWQSHFTEVSGNLATYVREGGSIYTSDWAFGIFEAAFPDAVDFYGNDSFEDVIVGVAGNIRADVIDPNFRTILGSNVADLRYDLDSWAVAVSAGSNADILIQGDAQTFDWWTFSYDTVRSAPLALRISRGEGRAIYTSFHNENQITVDMQKLLEEIILSL